MYMYMYVCMCIYIYIYIYIYTNEHIRLRLPHAAPAALPEVRRRGGGPGRALPGEVPEPQPRAVANPPLGPRLRGNAGVHRRAGDPRAGRDPDR